MAIGAGSAQMSQYVTATFAVAELSLQVTDPLNLRADMAFNHYYKLETLDITHKRVRCNGRVLDKCALSSLIHEVAGDARANFPLWSDIYWDSATYAELRERLEIWLVRRWIWNNLNYC